MVTMFLTEFQQSRVESQLPKSTKNSVFGCLIKVVIIQQFFK